MPIWEVPVPANKLHKSLDSMPIVLELSFPFLEFFFSKTSRESNQGVVASGMKLTILALHNQVIASHFLRITSISHGSIDIIHSTRLAVDRSGLAS